MRQDVIEEAQTIASNLVNVLNLPFEVEICDTLSKEHPYYFGADISCPDIHIKKYLLTLQYGIFPKETDDIRIKKYSQSLDYLIRHELAHKILTGIIGTKENSQNSIGILEVYAPKFQESIKLKTEYYYPYWHTATEIAIDKITMNMDDWDITESLIYTVIRSYKELSQINKNPLKKMIHKDRFFHFVKILALFKEIGINSITNDVENFINKKYFRLRRKTPKIIDIYREMYRNTCVSKLKTINQ